MIVNLISNFSVVSVKDDENINANATSSEILEDVLKQLDKLGTDKRNRILKKLKGSLALQGTDVEETTERSTMPKLEKFVSTEKVTDTESIQDEVEMLDLHEPKMGSYKRKRSMYRRPTFVLLINFVRALV